MNNSKPCFTLHEDETISPEYKWCPSCGYNAMIITWHSKLGKRYRCICGLHGRFGDGLEEPKFEQEI